MTSDILRIPPAQYNVQPKGPCEFKFPAKKPTFTRGRIHYKIAIVDPYPIYSGSSVDIIPVLAPALPTGGGHITVTRRSFTDESSGHFTRRHLTVDTSSSNY